MTDEVLFNQEGSLGVITLNRPSALNALTLNMILSIQRQLSLWKEDAAIHAVVVRAVPGNAFCAGGDIRSLYFSGQVNDAEQMQFFWHEYRLNHFIHHFGKPYIALIDGIVMGGGVGISMHGSHPIASERFVFAMPETGIGFFPDIGASYLLTRCPGSLGVYLGLTGNRLSSHDAMKAGLVKKIVSSEQMPALYDALMNEDLSTDAIQRVNRCVQAFNSISSTDEVSQIKPLIDVCFAHPTVEMIRESLQSANTVWAEAVDNTLAQKSPLSLKVTLAQLQKAKGLSLAQCLQMDYDIVSHFMHGHDFYEGVRALLIDKDKNPQWHPARLDLVSEQMVQKYFERLHPGLECI
ncbi:enoyl-CoA hydratase/isomerase family protein [Legionella qingyii]|uniref:3-hydroxyisobutyryl-CoA hydrolase n=1 Tax=Legionella qingyii TaxID=2184757 RepID=A0A317U975_9GAMM|nr:enoyl-CoA hydratase/isomerase family protein [Legionella qingyii]PWY57476.1 enoyl-CoA hydratase/isomerase family protein [Legionella qingyii]RUR23341.1 enoyl-CoA hydratase/isomerase family protein [Legionella qingyii]RUR26559.1 enoyl-CoA hydratase/isomerase family protein [Legionella qingyii]